MKRQISLTILKDFTKPFRSIFLANNNNYQDLFSLLEHFFSLNLFFIRGHSIVLSFSITLRPFFSIIIEYTEDNL